MSGDSGAAATSSSAEDFDPAVVLADLRSADDRWLGDHDLLELITACGRLASWANARQLAAVAEFARRPARVEVRGEDRASVTATYAPLGRVAREYVDEELAVQLRVSRQQAAMKVSLATGLVRLPATRAALAAGRIDSARARVLTEELADLDRTAASQVEVDLAERAERMAPARLRERARKAVLDADPAAAQVRSRRARGDRAVWFQPLPDGMAEIGARLSALDAVAVREAIGAAARAWRSARAAGSGDTRTMDQLMADAFVAPFTEALATGTLLGAAPVRLAERRGQAACVQVTVAASTLLGLDEASCELEGYGPVTADVARELTDDARLRRLLTDPVSGVVLDVGTTVYRPTAPIDRHVKARAQRCSFPDCGWPAVACELDHCIPFPRGSTSERNNRPHCARHHHFKHSPGVRIESGPRGFTRWTMPTGHVHDVEPPAVGVPIRGAAPLHLVEPFEEFSVWALVDHGEDGSVDGPGGADDDIATWWDDTG